jgi:hypothetical protein
MSVIRLSGLLVSIGVLLFALIYFRGGRWHRGTFLLSMLLGFALFVVSLAPDTINVFRDILNLRAPRKIPLAKSPRI